MIIGVEDARGGRARAQRRSRLELTSKTAIGGQDRGLSARAMPLARAEKGDENYRRGLGAQRSRRQAGAKPAASVELHKAALHRRAISTTTGDKAAAASRRRWRVRRSSTSRSAAATPPLSDVSRRHARGGAPGTSARQWRRTRPTGGRASPDAAPLTAVVAGVRDVLGRSRAAPRRRRDSPRPTSLTSSSCSPKGHAGLGAAGRRGHRRLGGGSARGPVPLLSQLEDEHDGLAHVISDHSMLPGAAHVARSRDPTLDDPAARPRGASGEEAVHAGYEFACHRANGAVPVRVQVGRGGRPDGRRQARQEGLKFRAQGAARRRRRRRGRRV